MQKVIQSKSQRELLPVRNQMAQKTFSIEDCTVPEKILLAAHQLEENGQSPFTAEALIVVAWQKYPKTFGLKGFDTQYPDSNKVLASIMGEKGLARRGWLSKAGQKLYTLTKDGHVVVKRILKGEDRPASKQSNVRVNKEVDKNLLAIMDCVAMEKITGGLKQEVTFTEACKFWGVVDGMNSAQIDHRLASVRKTIDHLDRQIGLGTAVLSSGQSISQNDVSKAVEAFKYLEERFARHLNLLRARTAKV
ncbi:MAG: hypothetical protein RIR17_1129 [Planctomycetota bacterium]|jgi:hypothetical protein